MKEPVPLRRDLGAPPEYPLDALGPVLGPAARALHDLVQAPAAIAAQSLLAAASLAVQPHADVQTRDGRVLPLTLWLVTVAASGERKSATDKYALSMHHEREALLEEAYRAKLVDYQLEAMAYATAVEATKKKNKNRSTAEIKAALADLGEPPMPPPSPMLMCSEPTFEAVQKTFMAGAPSLGLFTSEGAEFFGGHGMNEKNRGRSVGGYCKLWDDGYTDRTRAGDGRIKLRGRRLALHLMMQPVVAEQELGDDLLAGQGFLARCLVSWPATVVGTRKYRPANPAADPRMADYYERMRRLLKRTPATGEAGDLRPQPLLVDNDAHRLWVAFHDRVEELAAPDKRYGGDVRPWALRSAEQALRIAGVLAMVDDPDATRVDADSMKHAIDLAGYYVEEGLRLGAAAAPPPAVRDAEAILRFLHAKQLETVTARQLVQTGPNRLRSVAAIAAPMDLLVENGWAKPMDAATGKAPRAWRINLPALEAGSAGAPPAAPASSAPPVDADPASGSGGRGAGTAAEHDHADRSGAPAASPAEPEATPPAADDDIMTAGWM